MDCCPDCFVRGVLFAAGRLLLRRLFLASHLPQFAQLSVQAMPQGAFGPEFLQEGLGPGKCLFVDLVIAKKGSPRPLDFIFGKQSSPRNGAAGRQRLAAPGRRRAIFRRRKP